MVHNPERGLGEGDPSKEISFMEELSLRVLEGDPYQEFGHIQDVEVDSAGNIFILDSRNYRVVSFTAEGEFRWEVGEKGGGPGEFKRPEDLTLGRTGDFFVLDTGNRRIDHFSAEGRYLKSIKPIWIQRAISSVSYLPEGRFLLTVAIPGAIGSQGYVINSQGERLFEMGEVLRYGHEVHSL